MHNVAWANRKILQSQKFGKESTSATEFEIAPSFIASCSYSMTLLKIVLRSLGEETAVGQHTEEPNKDSK